MPKQWWYDKKNARLQNGDIGIMCEDPLLQNWKNIAGEDADYKDLLEFKRSGRMVKESPPDHPVRSFAGTWGNVKLMDGDRSTLLIYESSRIIPPEKVRAQLIRESHKSHKIIDGITQLRAYYFWPKMQEQAKEEYSKC